MKKLMPIIYVILFAIAPPLVGAETSILKFKDGFEIADRKLAQQLTEPGRVTSRKDRDWMIIKIREWFAGGRKPATIPGAGYTGRFWLESRTEKDRSRASPMVITVCCSCLETEDDDVTQLGTYSTYEQVAKNVPIFKKMMETNDILKALVERSDFEDIMGDQTRRTKIEDVNTTKALLLLEKLKGQFTDIQQHIDTDPTYKGKMESNCDYLNDEIHMRELAAVYLANGTSAHYIVGRTHVTRFVDPLSVAFTLGPGELYDNSPCGTIGNECSIIVTLLNSNKGAFLENQKMLTKKLITSLLNEYPGLTVLLQKDWRRWGKIPNDAFNDVVADWIADGISPPRDATTGYIKQSDLNTLAAKLPPHATANYLNTLTWLLQPAVE
ncbi:MAG: hypothetical protein LBL99_01010 [Holosporaceae bacterium]|jgi:hypothetical protein|nr:hypothetical protein [Holosporaceae bacterium]